MKKTTHELLELDAKDQKILAELFKDGRASFSRIAKKTQMSKDVVKYRMDKFVETGFMTNVNTIVDITKLGWSSALVFFKLKNLRTDKLNNFVAHLTQSPTVAEILEFAGGWDLAARMHYANTEHLGKLVNELENKFADIISDNSIFFLSENIVLPYRALFGKYADEDEFIHSRKKAITYKPGNLDLKILSAISSDSRKPLIQLQEELKENRMTIHNRIQKMLKAGIIDSFRPNLFTEKLGFHWYAVSLKINNQTEMNKIINQIRGITSCHWIMKGFGAADIVFYCQVKTVQDLQRILYKLRETLGEELKSIESANVIKDYKWDFFPKGFLEEYEKTMKE